MAMITKKDIEGLSNIHSTFCVSIFIPTHRTGEEVLRKEDALQLKNQLKAVKKRLLKQELSAKEVDELVAPAQELVDDSLFWRHQSDGLALFLTHGFFKKYSLPVTFEAFNHVANDFYLKPLLPLFTGDGAFYILALELERVRLFENTRHSISELIIDDLIPKRMEERVGYDYEQKGLQFRSQQDAHGGAAFHGHAEADRNREKEIINYFRSIDKGLMSRLKGEEKPMVVATQDFLFPLYKKVNTYGYLLEEPISCNLSESDKELLHSLAWEKMSPIFDRERQEKMALYKAHEGSGRTSADIHKVVPAAWQGKIEALFMEGREDIWGVYDPSHGTVEVQKEYVPPNVSLLNMAALQTFLNGGKVYLLERDEMPNPYSKVNAIYRF